MEATIGEEHRRALDYDRLAVDLNQYTMAQAITSVTPMPDALLEALDDLVEALEYAGDAQSPTDELVKAKNAFVSVRESLGLMEQHGFRRSAIVQDIAAKLQKVISDLEPGQSAGGPAPSPT
jgi:hypothetical protein